MQTKHCSKCDKDLLLSEFHKNQAWCKSCGKEYNRKHRKENPQMYRNRAKKWHQKVKQKCVDYKGGKCSVCGYSKCLAALEFHHINPEEKDFQIGRRGIDRHRQWGKWLEKELDKCLLLCANCHRELHSWE